MQRYFDEEEIRLREQISELLADEWSWVKDPHNYEVVVHQRRAFFHPVYAFGTAAVKGEKKLTGNTVAYWEIDIRQQLYGTSLMFGIGTLKADNLARCTFIDLIGKDEHSYGITHLGTAIHAGVSIKIGKKLHPSRCIIGLLFDGPRKTLTYFENGKFLCTPFTEIDTSRDYYPMVASTAQQSQFYVMNQKTIHIVRPLADLALSKLADTLPPQATISLPLPKNLINQLLHINRKRKRPFSDLPPGYQKSNKNTVAYADTLRPIIEIICDQVKR
ncbi:hypothetical protein WR25_09552 [Diploscapter pachys]|uniref:B30.2/SPRY domain-containing protein n=1 Tax=Diploscapter pachys TaxID=2018661 RepID=A0A2A2KXA2_9BILA|nr:hypothetical protein WR25_09552 [Diploscapter pachys]